MLQAIAKVKDHPEEVVTVDSNFEELGVDSFDAIEIVFELEERFNLDIPDEVARSIETVSDVVDQLERVLASEGAGAGEASSGTTTA